MFANFCFLTLFVTAILLLLRTGVRVKMGLEDTIKIVEDLTRIH
jgi:hypothetical protein